MWHPEERMFTLGGLPGCRWGFKDRLRRVGLWWRLDNYTHPRWDSHWSLWTRSRLCPMVAYQAPTSPINPPLRSWRLIRSWLALSFREDRTTLLSGARTGNRILTTVTFERFPSAMRPHWTQSTEAQHEAHGSCFNKIVPIWAGALILYSSKENFTILGIC